MFERLVESFVRTFQGRTDVLSIIQGIRQCIVFHPTPPYSRMERGEFDCVGSAYITTLVLRSLLGRHFRVVAFPQLPWLDDRFNDSKHCGVIELRDGQPFKLYDPTPINGYGYGRTALPLRLSEWAHRGDQWLLRCPEPIESSQYWEEHLYPRFTILEDDEVLSILGIVDANSRSATHRMRPPLTMPSQHSGWQKEYWRVLGRQRAASGDLMRALDAYQNALDINSCNPHILREAAKICRLSGQATRSEELFKKEVHFSRLLVSAHERARRFWQKKAEAALEDGEWETFIYYAGAAFWRKQSIAELEGRLPEEIPIVRFGSAVPLYRLTPGWFHQRGARVALESVFGKLPEIDYHQQGPWLVRPESRLEEFHKNYLRIPDPRGGSLIVRVLPREVPPVANRTTVETNDPVTAHRWAVGLLRPDLLILL